MPAAPDNQRLRVSSARRGPLLAGGIVALVSSVAAALLVTHTAPAGTESLARLALVAPAGLYGLWWLTTLRFAGRKRAAAKSSPVSRSHSTLVQTTFDATASFTAPRREATVERGLDEFRRTLRRPGGAVPDELRPGFADERTRPDSASSGS